MNCPPQKVQFADLDSPDLLNKTWWLFFKSAEQATNLIFYGSSAQRTDPTAPGYLQPVALADGAVYVETDTGLIYQLRAGVWVFISGTQLTDLTLTVASTKVNAPTTGAREWVVILRQDATGGRAVVWGTNITADAASLDTTASTVSSFRFVLSGGKYVQNGQPTTGMS